MGRRSVPSRSSLAAAILAALAGLTLLASGPASAQSAEDGSGVSRLGTAVRPRISITETWTDNLTLAGDCCRDRALITSISPGVTITSQSGLVRGTLDYALDGIVYLKSDSKNRVQNQLNARGAAELVPQAVYVDVVGNISQQSVSAFGQQTPSGQLDNPNRTEMRQLQVSPYWRGNLAGLASFELRADGTVRQSSESGAYASGTGDSKDGALSLTLAGPQGRLLNWGLQANTRRTHFDQTGLDNRSAMVLGSLNWVPDIDWMLGINGGRERNDYLGETTTTIYGASLKWTPTPRTVLAGDWQHHNYGDSHNLRLEHRMTQFVLRATSSQSVNTGSATPNGQLNNYAMLDLQFTGLEPDPVKRDLLVRATLAALGLSPDAISSNGFIANSAMLQRRTEVSLGYNGPRLTVTLTGNDNNSRALGVAPGGSGDLALSNHIRQRGATLSVAYRLTPTASASVTATRQHSSGEGDTLGSDLKSLFVNASVRLGPRSEASFGLRHTRSEDSFVAYRENALFATLTQRF